MNNFVQDVITFVQDVLSQLLILLPLMLILCVPIFFLVRYYQDHYASLVENYWWGLFHKKLEVGEFELAEKEPWFWQIIAETISKDGAKPKQLNAMRRALRKLSERDVMIFYCIFDLVMARSYTWKLWGAAYVAMGGCGDDSFDYFRTWLVSRGKSFFETILGDPDSLAILLPAEFRKQLQFEGLGYVALEVWAEKTGKGSGEMLRYLNTGAHLQSQPSGEPFSEEPSQLAECYPNLWARYGKRTRRK